MKCENIILLEKQISQNDQIVLWNIKQRQISFGFYNTCIILYKSMNQQIRCSQKISIMDFQNLLGKEDSQSVIGRGQQSRANQKQLVLKYKLEQQEKLIQAENRLNMQEALQFYQMTIAHISKNKVQTSSMLIQGTLKNPKDTFKYLTFNQEEMDIELQSQKQERNLDKDLQINLNSESQKQVFLNICMEQFKKNQYPTAQDYQFGILELLKKKKLTMAIIRRILRDKIRNKLVYETYIKKLKNQCKCQDQECSQCLDLINYIYKDKLEQLKNLYSQHKKALLKSFLHEFYPIIFDESYLQQGTIPEQNEPNDEEQME